MLCYLWRLDMNVPMNGIRRKNQQRVENRGKKLWNKLMIPMNSTMIPILAHPVSTKYIPTKNAMVPGNLDRDRNNDFRLAIPNVMVKPTDISICGMHTVIERGYFCYKHTLPRANKAASNSNPTPNDRKNTPNDERMSPTSAYIPHCHHYHRHPPI